MNSQFSQKELIVTFHVLQEELLHVGDTVKKIVIEVAGTVGRVITRQQLLMAKFIEAVCGNDDSLLGKQI
ncbi:hypothetical protein ACIQZI_16600 [Peribacillus sp. NPDC096379]|uniref:hypothetical protein n=1 Tax=Peribacillus sp. NPDC096379 TaxID=3364393 RepID=UPI003828037E